MGSHKVSTTRTRTLTGCRARIRLVPCYRMTKAEIRVLNQGSAPPPPSMVVLYCRTTSASTAPCTFRKMGCPMHCASYTTATTTVAYSSGAKLRARARSQAVGASGASVPSTCPCCRRGRGPPPPCTRDESFFIAELAAATSANCWRTMRWLSTMRPLPKSTPHAYLSM